MLEIKRPKKVIFQQAARYRKMSKMSQFVFIKQKQNGSKSFVPHNLTVNAVVVVVVVVVVKVEKQSIAKIQIISKLSIN